MHVVADRVAHSVREFTADDLIVKVAVLRWLNPVTCLRVADRVNAVLWLLATLPEGRIIKPCEFNPLAIEAYGVFKVCRDVGIAIISWESIVRAI